MTAKFIAVAFLIAAAQGGDINGHGPVQSSFSYGVSDPHTGDVKDQHETRIGDSVVGQYSLHESDGTKRTVDYSADAHNGFTAVVHKDPLYDHATPAVAIVAPIVANTNAAHVLTGGYASKYPTPHANGYSNGYDALLVGGYANGHAAPLATGYSSGFTGYGAFPAPYLNGAYP